jgi:hypothetical protein
MREKDESPSFFVPLCKKIEIFKNNINLCKTGNQYKKMNFQKQYKFVLPSLKISLLRLCKPC